MVRKISRPTRRSRARSTSDVIKWPRPDEPVDVSYALMAIAFGNAEVLARYLREAQPVYSGITDLVAFMLDPEGHPPEEPDEDGDRAVDWCRAWRLEFKRAGRGNRKNFAEIDMRLWGIGLFIESQISQGVKAESAKEAAMAEFGISLAQANKSLAAARRFIRSRPDI